MKKFIIVLVLCSCNLVDFEDAVSPSAENDNNKSIPINGKATIKVVSKSSKLPLESVNVHYNIYLSHPYVHLVDPYLINSQTTFSARKVTNSEGLITIDFSTDLAKNNWPSYELIFEFAFQENPHPEDIQTFNASIANVLGDDKLTLKNLTFTIEK